MKIKIFVLAALLLSIAYVFHRLWLLIVLLALVVVLLAALWVIRKRKQSAAP